MRLLLLGVLVACGPRPHAETPSNSARSGGELVLYRDRALVRQRVEFEVPPAGYATVRARIAAGVEAEDIYVVERDRFTIREIRVPGDPQPKEEAPAMPRDIELVIGAPRAGRFAVHLGYLTERIHWEAAYTMTTTAARDRAVVRGALAIRNATGITLQSMDVRVVDAELGPSIQRAAEIQSHSYVGAEPTTTPSAIPRDIGRVDVVDGETRVELLANSKPREMRSVLVYDPVGTDLDRTSAAPVRDIALGADITSTRVTESFEVARDVVATRGLPAGPVRLLERRGDGTLVVLAEARLFDVATRVAQVDTIAVGTANDVTGRRERREYTFDEFRKRLVEEFVITIDNKRPRPVEVVVREHLYRGQNWSIADPIQSQRPVKEGPQQFSMRTTVRPQSQAKLFYAVVYTWRP